MLESLYKFIDNNETTENIYILGTASLVYQGLIKKEIYDIDILVHDGENFYKKRDNVDPVIWEITFLSEKWKERVIFFEEYKGIKIYGLCLEDIIVNKISGYPCDKHKTSIKELLDICDKEKFNKYYGEAKQRGYSILRDSFFKENVMMFEKDFNIQ